MAITVPNGGEVIALDAVTGKTAATGWTLRLYTAISPIAQQRHGRRAL
jgi:hypothetical protein